MTVWDFLDKIMGGWPPVTALFLAAALSAVVIFIIGFSRHGANFIKYGFKQTALDASIESRFDELKQSISDLRTEVKGEINDLRTEVNDLRTEVRGEVGGLRTELNAIKDNHFGHLKNYLGILNGILLDKEIISNQEKARLDNELRGM